MSAPEISQDICRCSHPASAHINGEGECDHCQAAGRTRIWGQLAACKRFAWNGTWEERTA